MLDFKEAKKMYMSIEGIKKWKINLIMMWL